MRDGHKKGFEYEADIMVAELGLQDVKGVTTFGEIHKTVEADETVLLSKVDWTSSVHCQPVPFSWP